MKDYEIKLELLFYGVRLSNTIRKEFITSGKIEFRRKYTISIYSI